MLHFSKLSLRKTIAEGNADSMFMGKLCDNTNQNKVVKLYFEFELSTYKLSGLIAQTIFSGTCFQVKAD